MELQVVNVYTEEEQRLMYINKQIKDRINTLLSNQYNVKNGYIKGEYYIYRKPIYYSDNKFKNIIKRVVYSIDFLIRDFIHSNKYFIMYFIVENNKIIVDVYSPNQVKKFQGTLDMWFNSLDNVEVIIRKQYPEWKYQ